MRPRWDTSNPVVWRGQELLHPCSRTQLSTAPLLPQLPWGAPEGYGCLGVFPQWEDGAGAAPAPLPVHSPMPGRRSSRGLAMWRPARQPGLRGDPSPVPVAMAVRCAARLLLVFCPAAINRNSPAPPSCWLDGTARCPWPVGSRGSWRGWGRCPPEQGRGGFIHHLMVYFQFYPWPCPCWRGRSCEQPPAAISPPAHAGPGEKPLPRRRPAPAIPRGRCFA